MMVAPDVTTSQYGSVVTIFDPSGYTIIYAHVGEVGSMRSPHLHFGFETPSTSAASTIKPFLALQALDHTALASARVSAEDREFARDSSAIDVLGSLRAILRTLGQTPTIIYQPAPEEGFSLRTELMSWAPLLGLFLTPTAGFGMMVLAWLGHHRKRREGILLQLQIVKINLENENLTLVNRNLVLTNERLEIEVRALRQEADKSRIISA